MSHIIGIVFIVLIVLVWGGDAWDAYKQRRWVRFGAALLAIFLVLLVVAMHPEVI